MLWMIIITSGHVVKCDLDEPHSWKCKFWWTGPKNVADWTVQFIGQWGKSEYIKRISIFGLQVWAQAQPNACIKPAPGPGLAWLWAWGLAQHITSSSEECNWWMESSSGSFIWQQVVLSDLITLCNRIWDQTWDPTGVWLVSRLLLNVQACIPHEVWVAKGKERVLRYSRLCLYPISTSILIIFITCGRVQHGYRKTCRFSKTGSVGKGKVVDLSTPCHTVYLYHGIMGMHG